MEDSEMISVKHVDFSYERKSRVFGGSPFIQDVSFRVGTGEIFGFLGPSGAGKSTLQKIMTGILTGYTGSVRVANLDPVKGGELYHRIGVDFEFPSLYEKLTARENLQFFASLYATGGRKRCAAAMNGRIALLLEGVGLTADADKTVGAFSKGMKSRLNFIKALVHDPDVLFLDEPTSGLDPANAAAMKSQILELKRCGKTIILTTHNMYDAAELCDRVAFIVNGRIKALDTPHNLIMRRGGSTITYSWLESAADGTRTEYSAVCPLGSVSQDVRLVQLIAENRIASIHSGEPTLNDVFVEVTGTALV
ncbi:ABC transporter ATP-binding protein [Treponema brennaborense]|uniref:ABC transporter related protein n=1 Tax=Treponema brennaborense (strain DSM 12168 / CIP 105900 / DD5/3) TaxID=906968 RepID=F4LIL2_TREBD|nr:ABC transporter ATP-binding protein [Treponema brennaborense]AEE17237.1 ABC transporter related protein [Treponema brennaborense DSM 12168]